MKMSQPIPTAFRGIKMASVLTVVLISASLLSGIVNAQDADAAAAAASAAAEELFNARELAKPWLMRKIELGGTRLPFTPASVIALLVFVLNIWMRMFGSSQWAEASHILIKDPSEKTKTMMNSMKKDIGNDLKKFEEFAQKYSQCPSKAEKGNLGRFKPGDMTPPFDSAVFNPLNATQTTLGPIQTQFGYHLIYIRDRKM